MKKRLLVLALLASFACRALGVLTQEQLTGFQQKLDNPDPKVRASALTELEKAHPETAGNEILLPLSKALADRDAGVRAGAAASLAMIAFITGPKFKQLAANETDLRSCPPLQKALIATFNDADEETRKNALVAYAFTFAVPGEVQNTLVGRYDSERQMSTFRRAILVALTIDGTPTSAARALLMRVANTPNGSALLAQIIRDSKAPPVELLPLFVNQLNAAHDSAHRALFARAIEKFGATAKPYIPSLARAAGLESDDVTRQTIRNAMAAIGAAK